MQETELRYKYSDAIDDLVNNNVITKKDVYEYAGDPLEIGFDQMFQFSQQQLLDICKRADYDIEPAQFYFIDDMEVDAGACSRKNGYFRIEVSRGTIEYLFNTFCNNDIIDDPDLSDYKEFGSFLEKSDLKVSVSYLMFQWSLMFIFYHELGHLIQFTNIEKLNQGTRKRQAIHEKYMIGNGKFNLQDHMDEFDADLHGSQELGSDLHTFWKLLPPEAQTPDNLKKLVVIALVGALGFFTMLQPDTEIYFFEHTHPHLFIRMMWISQSLIKNIGIYHPDLNDREIVNETRRVLNVYSKHRGYRTIEEQYQQKFGRDIPRISQYMHFINDTAKSGAYPYLASNTIHTR